MSGWKMLIGLVLLAAIVLFAFDAVSILNAHRDVSDVASASAGAAAAAIAEAKKPAVPGAKPPATPRSAANSTAAAHGDVVIAYDYDPVAARVKVTVSGTAKSIVLHYFDKNLTENIKASAIAQPG
jgi:hypothetical protein